MKRKKRLTFQKGGLDIVMNLNYHSRPIIKQNTMSERGGGDLTKGSFDVSPDPSAKPNPKTATMKEWPTNDNEQVPIKQLVDPLVRAMKFAYYLV
jgi:hypothetical protein